MYNPLLYTTGHPTDRPFVGNHYGENVIVAGGEGDGRDQTQRPQGFFANTRALNNAPGANPFQ
jgi:hypothetical protein